ncbi:glutamate 2,3-aminomutase [Thermosyntropha sp.]|uniref:glutamate 2,3-aminomutase n=1 Tax=Thermosyntropha sp. TaxID=2740820 RepID=UPI0025CD0DBD|nr:glutamate 2,3-aminomutase [Thermosyntropha sp.]MBO8158325.1 glutamate 2,3-aminomutase [Thermosyntropha sp.]
MNKIVNLNKLEEDAKREIALKRAEELKQRINDYLEKEPYIETGFRVKERVEANKRKILEYFDATEDDWNNWVWQMKHRISKPEELAYFLPLNDKQYEELVEVSKHFRWAVSPYYLSLIDFENFLESPIYKQAVPIISELLDKEGYDDPMGENYTSPAPCITRRYPDRLIINVTNQCAMYCRHCQRRRNFGEKDVSVTRKELEQALDYIRKNKEIRDVLVTGGDALMLSDTMLDWILSELDSIPHVEIKRIGTRTLVTLPQRVTPELCTILEKHPPIYVNTQFNSPLEITPEAKKACDMLVKAGAVLGNQAVLLKGINDDEYIMKKLNQELLKIRVRPYYIFHAKQVKGTSHFITKVETGIKIMEKLRGYTSGLAVPTYIINAPNGYGKTPMLPEYLLSMGDEEITIRTWENKVMNYKNKTY